MVSWCLGYNFTLILAHKYGVAYLIERILTWNRMSPGVHTIIMLTFIFLAVWVAYKAADELVSDIADRERKRKNRWHQAQLGSNEIEMIDVLM